MGIENDKYFLELNEWYDDIELYNIIGFLHIYDNVSFEEIKEIINNSDEYPILKLKERAKKLILNNNINNIDDLEKLKYTRYGKKASNRKKYIRTVLILFNVAYATELNIRLDFDYFFKNKKDELEIEHIFAFKDPTREITKNRNSMWNLSLLDKDTNVALSNDVFCDKKLYLYNNRYNCKLLPCTEAVFNKKFSKNSTNMEFWSEEDGRDYIAKMKSTLKNFLK